MKQSENRKNSIAIWVITGILVMITVLLIIFFISYSSNISRTEKDVVYDRYYALITDDTESSFFRSVYEAASDYAKSQNVFLDMISDNLSMDYSETELMEIAIASDVDGIIVASEETEEMGALIDKAYASKIPVVTLLSDNTNSERLSFVGISNYNLGKEYGNLILELAGSKTFSKETIKVVVLVDSNAKDTEQNVLVSGIQETVENEPAFRGSKHNPIEISMYAVDSTNNFSVEESIRGLFLTGKASLPDIVVCLNEIDTKGAYQAVVDYNEVGLVNILGYYDSEAILKGIERNVIYATVSIDAEKLGRFCVDALSEYYALGNTSQYFTTDISVITKENVNEYMEGHVNEE